MEKTVNNVQENVNEAMDSRIVRMNEIKAIKLSSVSSKKRVAIKAAKTLIDYIMANWDDMASLAVPAVDPEIRETQPELVDIINSRREELDRKKNEELERKRKEEEAAAKAREEEELKKLAQKLKEESKKEDKPQSQKKSPEPTKKQNNQTPAVGRGHKVERKIGDIHPNGKWVWVEYMPGKFDWRTIGSRAHQDAIKNGLKPSGIVPDKSSAVKTKEKKGKAASKAQKEPKKQESKKMTMEELDNAIKGLPKNGMSEAQKTIIKYIKKGYKITSDHLFLESADGDRKSIVWGAVEAIMKRIKVTEENLPKGLFK